MAKAALMAGPGGRRRRPRRCVALRERRERSRLVRFLRDPEGRIVADLAGRLPGRGLWLSADRDVVNRAVARNVFAKALRGPVRVDGDLAAEVERGLAARCLDLVGLARRAGQAVWGFDQVEAALRHGRAALLLAARDGAPDGRRKLRALAPGLPLLTAFDRVQLGQALGREATVHAALLPGGLARRLLQEAGRLAGFSPGSLEAAIEGAPSLRGRDVPGTGTSKRNTVVHE